MKGGDEQMLSVWDVLAGGWVSWSCSPYVVSSAQPMSTGWFTVVMLAGGAGSLYMHSPF